MFQLNIKQSIQSLSKIATPQYQFWVPIGIIQLMHIILSFIIVPKLTKRVILSRTAKLFDLLGWLAPVVIKAKILIQHLWQEEKGWDDEIDPKYQKI